MVLPSHSDSLKYSIEQSKKANGLRNLSIYNRKLLEWYRNVDKNYAWIVLFALWLVMAILLGPYRCYGLIFAKITEEKIYTREEASWPVTLAVTVENLMAPLVSICCFHMSKRSALLVGAILVSLGNAACWMSWTLWQDILFYGFVHGLGYAFIFTPLMEIINEYFLCYRSIAFGFVLCGSTMSVFLLAPAFQYILDNYFWRDVYLAIGIFCTLNIMIVPLLRPNPRPKPLNLLARTAPVADLDNKENNNFRKGSLSTWARDSIRREARRLMEQKTVCNSLGVNLSESIGEKELETLGDTLGAPIRISGNSAQNSPAGTLSRNMAAQCAMNLAAKQRQLNHDYDASNQVACTTLQLDTAPAQENHEQSAMSLLIEMIKMPVFHIIWINECVYYWVNTIFMLVLVDYAIDRGCSHAQANSLLNFTSLGELIGRLLLTILVDMRLVTNKSFVVITLIALGLSLVLITQISGFVYISSLTVMIMALSALLYILLNGLLVDCLGENRVTLGYGLASFISSIIMLFRSTAVGFCRDYLNTYEPLVLAMAISCVFTALLWLLEPLLTRLFVGPKVASNSIPKSEPNE